MPNGTIELAFGDGDQTFNVARIGQALELEEKCGAGVSEILDRLRTNRWKLNDVRETIRLGLIGGGMTPVNALNLVKRYVDERPWGESLLVAQAVMIAAIIGVPGDLVGKTKAGGPRARRRRASSAPRSTEQAPPSDSRRGRSTRLPSGSLPPASTGSTVPTEATNPRP
jgi:hypothetical protein